MMQLFLSLPYANISHTLYKNITSRMYSITNIDMGHIKQENDEEEQQLPPPPSHYHQTKSTTRKIVSDQNRSWLHV